MSEIFDIYNLMILALAVAIFLRLRSVLGRRTGNERPPYDYAARSGGRRPDNVVSLPRTPSTGAAQGGVPADLEERLAKHAKKGTPLYDALGRIIAGDPAFAPASFLSGAQVAYEMVVTAFAAGDRDTLRPLLSPEVLDGFDVAITEREKVGNAMTTTLIGIDKIAITDASMKGDTARVTVRINSQMITATTNQAGEFVDGDPNKVVDVVDVWTFERRTTAPDPNWMLVATESA